jgi:DNA ligase-1
MKRFTTLITALDQTNRTTEKVQALADYFREAPPRDGVWALYLLSGRRSRRPLPGRKLRDWVGELAGLPSWLVEESYQAVGDLAETLAALHPPVPEPRPKPLHRIMEEQVAPLTGMEEDQARKTVLLAWSRLDRAGRFAWNKLLTGGFRLGAGRTLVLRGLSEATGLPRPLLAHRTSGQWEPTLEAWERITAPAGVDGDVSRPYPFFLAHPLEGSVEELGPREEWLAEWKWDGIRAQLIRRGNEVLLWSRGQELVSHQFPEVVEAARPIPEGTVLDGEILAWGEDGVLPFNALQRRLNRKRVGPKLLEQTPARFLAYDLLEWRGQDIRHRPLADRREPMLAAVAEAAGRVIRTSPTVDDPDWNGLEARRDEARGRGVEGLMLKRVDAPYGVGRVKGPWVKWKVAPLNLDAVLLYAQRGHGRRASLYSDYTFAVKDGDDWVPVAKAYSGLTDAEIRQVDRWVRRNVRERFGPVRAVPPEHVFELAFDGIQASTRHRAGIALRFPRMVRWRQDKRPEEANTLEDVRALLRSHRAQGGAS